MRTLVVFESMFGNTETIARAVADGLATHSSVEVVEVGSAPVVVDAEVVLLVVGGPTHAFGLSRPGTRQSAIDQGATASRDTGLREWLAAARVPTRTLAAAFDTRIDGARLAGSAARAARRRLRRLGLVVTTPPASFFVKATPGPLVTGEFERARRWGADLGASLLTGLATGPA